MVFKPVPCRTRWEGLAVTLWILVLDLLFLTWAWRRPTDFIKFVLFVLIAVSIPLLVHVAYRTWGAFTLEYWVDRDAVTIRWANVRHIVPLVAIQHMIEEGMAEIGRPSWRYWPMPYVRASHAAEPPHDVLLCATQPLPQCLLLNTGEYQFAISPLDKAYFLEMLQEYYRIGPARNLDITEERTSSLGRFFGQSQIGLILIGIGLIGVLTLFGRLMVQFPGLPSPLPFRYNAEGLPEIVRDKGALFVLPAIGLLVWLLNGLWGVWMIRRQQATGAYMLWGGAIVVQICSLLALNSLLR